MNFVDSLLSSVKGLSTVVYTILYIFVYWYIKQVDTPQTGTLDSYAMTNEFKDMGNRSGVKRTM